MKRLLLLFLLLTATVSEAQQSPIMVCNSSGTICTPYKNLDSAILYATAGSYIYLPGGAFSVSDTLNKELHFIGAGHYSDSAQITHTTQIGNNLYVGSGCSNSSIEGINIIGDVLIAGNNVQNFQIANCRLNNLACINNGTLFTSDIRKSVITGFVNLYNSSGCTFSNCIIGYIIHLYSSNVLNSVLFSGNWVGCGAINGSIINMTNSTISNCIFYGIMGVVVSGISFCMPNHANNIILNNVTTSLACNLGGTETGTILNVPSSGIFANVQSPGFDYTKDFHTLPPYSSYGIYSGSTPYKEGGVPSNPHIYFKNIGGVTNTNGDLSIQINVRAEN